MTDKLYPIASCNVPDAVHGTKEGMVSARSTLQADRHGLVMYAFVHSLGVPMVSILTAGKVHAWPLSVVHDIVWGEEPVPAPKPVKGK